MSEKPTNPALEKCQTFIGKLREADDSAAYAQLKRNAGKTVSEARTIPPLFWQSLPYNLYPDQEERYFLVATLFPFVKDTNDSDRNFGSVLKRIRNEQNEKGLNRRFTALLDADEQQLPFRLRQLIMRLKGQENIHLNWALLLYHLTHWEHDGRWVQLNWARAYFGSEKSEENNQTNQS